MSFIKRGDALPILHTVKRESVEDEKAKQAEEALELIKESTQKPLPGTNIPGNKIESN